MVQSVIVPISNPGVLGLNTQQANVVQPIGWATIASNAVYNENGSLAARQGYRHLHASSISEDVRQIHTYVDASGSTLLIWSTATKLYKVVGTTATDITGTATTPTAGDWKFQNFNGKCVGWQTGHTPIVLTTVGGSFADMVATAGSLPSGNECLSAFGRMWVLDGNTLKWSDLLLETAWTGGSSGSADLSIYWPQMDEAIGLAEHNDFLFVFGRNSILILTGAEDPSSIAVEDKVLNVGLAARDAKTPTPTDYAFATKRGITTLGRVIQEKSIPVTGAVPQVADNLSSAIQSAAAEADVRMEFSQEENATYLTTGTRMFIFDLTSDEIGARVLEWEFVPIALHEHNRVMYYGVTNYAAKRDGYLDGVASDSTGGSTYVFDFESAWHDGKDIDPALENRLKILKGAGTRIAGSSQKQFTFKWYLDFQDNIKSRVLSIPEANLAEHGTAIYNVDEFSGSVPIFNVRSGMSGAARVFKFGVSAEVDGDEFSIRALSIRTKIGRQVI